MDDAKIRNFSEFSNFLMKNLLKIEKIELDAKKHLVPGSETLVKLE